MPWRKLGALDGATARALREAFMIITRVRLEHHLAALHVGRRPDNAVDTDELPPVARLDLQMALRVVTAVRSSCRATCLWGCRGEGVEHRPCTLAAFAGRRPVRPRFGWMLLVLFSSLPRSVSVVAAESSLLDC